MPLLPSEFSRWQSTKHVARRLGAAAGMARDGWATAPVAGRRALDVRDSGRRAGGHLPCLWRRRCGSAPSATTRGRPGAAAVPGDRRSVRSIRLAPILGMPGAGSLVPPPGVRIVNTEANRRTTRSSRRTPPISRRNIGGRSMKAAEQSTARGMRLYRRSASPMHRSTSC